MSIPAEVVARESAAWVWFPEDAAALVTVDHLLVRWPDYYDADPELMGLTPRGDVAPALETVMGLARGWGAAALTCWVRLDAPAGLEEQLLERGGTRKETVAVLARELAELPGLDVPDDVVLRWCTDVASVRDGAEAALAAFGEGARPPEERLAALAEGYAADHREGRGGSLVAYRGGRPVGTGGVTIAGVAARLWGGGVAPAERGSGVYRALLAARLGYAREHGARLALVKGRVETSAPILRRAGFEAYGEERSYRLPLA